MIYQNDKNENTKNQFSNALKELQIGKLLRNSNITKSYGISENTYYRFLNETSYNWSRFLLLLAAKVTSRFDALTRPERVKVRFWMIL